MINPGPPNVAASQSRAFLGSCEFVFPGNHSAAGLAGTRRAWSGVQAYPQPASGLHGSSADVALSRWELMRAFPPFTLCAPQNVTGFQRDRTFAPPTPDISPWKLSRTSAPG